MYEHFLISISLKLFQLGYGLKLLLRLFDPIVEDIFYGCCKWLYSGYILLSNEDVFAISHITKMMYYMYISACKTSSYF